MANKNTRVDDLDHLDQSRFNRKEEGSKEHIEALLAMVHLQSKDSTLERLRNELIGTLNALEEGGSEKEQDERWVRYCVAIANIEKYCNSPAFIQSMYAAMRKQAGEKEATQIMTTKEGR